MSDFPQPPPNPLLPPAPSSAPPPPPVPFGVPPVPQFGGYAPTGYPVGYATSLRKPPRPTVKVGALLLILGGVGLVAGSALGWVTVEGSSFNGFSKEPISLDGSSNGGPLFVFLAVLLVGFGIAQLAARKVLAIAIIAVFFAAFAVLAVLGEMSDVSDIIEFADAFDAESSWGPGIPVLGVASLVGLGGAIATLARRRG